MIAGALVMGPELVVADEPVSMLDVSIRTELLRLMLDLRRERGLTYLFITHDLSLAWVIADRIAVMYLGKIMEIGPAEAVIRAAAQPVHEGPGQRLADARAADAAARAPSRTILVGETPDAAHVPTGCRFHPRCPLAFDRCRVEEPPLFDVGGGQPGGLLAGRGRQGAAGPAGERRHGVRAARAGCCPGRLSVGIAAPGPRLAAGGFALVVVAGSLADWYAPGTVRIVGAQSPLRVSDVLRDNGTLATVA